MKTACERKLEDLISVGPAIRRDFALLGINTVAELARRQPEALYRELCRKTRKQQDICVLDTFRAAIEQARDPSLPPEKCVWWYWSRVRKTSWISTTVCKSLGKTEPKSPASREKSASKHVAHGLGQRHDDSSGAKLAGDSAPVAGEGCGSFCDPGHKRINK